MTVDEIRIAEILAEVHAGDVTDTDVLWLLDKLKERDARIARLEAALDWIGHQPAMEYVTHIADKVCEMIGKGPYK